MDFNKLKEKKTLSAFITLRVSKESNTILKYEGTQPDSLNGYKDYTRDELKVELAKAEWQGEPY